MCSYFLRRTIFILTALLGIINLSYCQPKPTWFYLNKLELYKQLEIHFPDHFVKFNNDGDINVSLKNLSEPISAVNVYFFKNTSTVRIISYTINTKEEQDKFVQILNTYYVSSCENNKGFPNYYNEKTGIGATIDFWNSSLFVNFFKNDPCK